MKRKHHLKGRGHFFGGVLIAAGALFLWPGVSYAQEPFATVTAWEVQEFLHFKTGGDEKSLIVRLADATLVGHATGGLCAFSPAQTPCPLDARARSSVDLKTGRGPISGTFNLLVDTNPGSPLLMDLVHAGTGTLEGTLDLGPALLFARTLAAAGAPVALASGTWQSRELGAHGVYTGTFLIPIPSAALATQFGRSCALGWAYFNPLATPMLFECLTLKDFSLGAPVVKFTADLTKDAGGARQQEGKGDE